VVPPWWARAVGVNCPVRRAVWVAWDGRTAAADTDARLHDAEPVSHGRLAPSIRVRCVLRFRNHATRELSSESTMPERLLWRKGQSLRETLPSCKFAECATPPRSASDSGTRTFITRPLNVGLRPGSDRHALPESTLTPRRASFANRVEREPGPGGMCFRIPENNGLEPSCEKL
jgi:hypothetical protein